MRYKGRLIQWHDERGYGLIAPEEGEMQLFVHISAFENRQVRPTRGERLTYELGEDERGRVRAERVLRPGEKPARSWGKSKLAAALSVAIAFFLLLGGAVLLNWTSPLVLGFYLFASALAVLLYAWDKRAAQRDDWRTPEKTLHLLALAGGWPGALAAQHLFRHKSRKVSFLIIFWIMALLNGGALIWLHTPDSRVMLQAISGLAGEALRAAGLNRSGIYPCKDARGAVIYSNRPCTPK